MLRRAGGEAGGATRLNSEREQHGLPSLSPISLPPPTPLMRVFAPLPLPSPTCPYGHLVCVWPPALYSYHPTGYISGYAVSRYGITVRYLGI